MSRLYSIATSSAEGSSIRRSATTAGSGEGSHRNRGEGSATGSPSDCISSARDWSNQPPANKPQSSSRNCTYPRAADRAGACAGACPVGLSARFTDRSSTRRRGEEYRSSKWIRDIPVRPARDVARSRNAEAGWAGCSIARSAAGGSTSDQCRIEHLPNRSRAASERG